jgi:replicative DNA helicase Mcm
VIILKIIKPWIEIEKIDGKSIMQNIEKACRTCYRSENLITEESYKNLIKNCLNRGHGCYDDKTEVLTKDGWKYWKDITINDKFLSLAIDGGLEYLQPVQIFKYNYTGNLYHINKNGVNLMVTPNHNMYCCITTTKKGRKKELSSYKLYQMKDLINYTHSYYKGSEYVAYDTNCELSLAELRLYGFAIGDGYYIKEKQCLEFHIKKERKQKYLLTLCNQLGLNVRVSGNKYRIYDCSIFDKYSIYTDSKDKCISKELLYNINADQSYAILDGLINSDGCVLKTSIEYTTTSEILANQIQILCVMSGRFATINNNGKAKINNGRFGEKPIYVLTIGAARSVKPNIKDKTSIKQVPYNGYVYCAELPKNHTLYIRRCGKTVWCGNSVLEHEKITIRMCCDIRAAIKI